MVARLCLTAGCARMATYRGRCPQHAQQHDRTINRAGRRFYNTKRWRILRNWYLFHHSICECDQQCGQLAVDIHHRQDIADGGNPYDPQNLQALSKECHSKVTRQRQLGDHRTGGGK